MRQICQFVEIEEQKKLQISIETADKYNQNEMVQEIDVKTAAVVLPAKW